VGVILQMTNYTVIICIVTIYTMVMYDYVQSYL